LEHDPFGVAVGDLHGCVEPESGGSKGWSAQEVLDDRLGRRGVPVVIGLPFGHAPRRNAALGFGVRARLDADAICVGRRGRSELAEALLGSTSRQVVTNAQCPVLLAQAPRT